MKLRAPSIPIITIDPYISIWLPSDRLNDCDTVHWTGKDMPIRVYLTVKDREYILLGNDQKTEKAVQTDIQITAMSTKAIFNVGGEQAEITFTAPMFLDDYELLSRPLNYMHVSCSDKNARARVCVAEEICQDKRRQAEIITETASIDGISVISMKSEQQPILLRFGDDVRIDWGCFYLACKGGTTDCGRITDRGAETMYVTMSADVLEGAVFAFAYDDYKSIDYFHSQLTSFWNRDGESIDNVILTAYNEYTELKNRADAFDGELIEKATVSGGEKYAELLSLAYRQVLAAHKLVVDTNGSLLYISKECFSNGCAATVDVSYPSVPLFLLFNPELVKGMLRPIFRYASMPDWRHEFAPHDVGTYPILWGQTYGGTIEDVQMPIEECGNMLLMTAAVCIAQKDFSFAEGHYPLLKQWADYLVKNGGDPENQLCTDDFAGHSAHNCNLAVKAIMAIEAMAIISDEIGEENDYHNIALGMAEDWERRAADDSGCYRLSFDKSGTFSMKYNIIWDKLFGTHVFKNGVIEKEFSSYKNRLAPYGMPLDSRETYTKSDWLLWTASLADKKEDFELFADLLWNAYNFTKCRVPMADWYDSVTAEKFAFQHRSVQGGLFIKLLLDRKILNRE